MTSYFIIIIILLYLTLQCRAVTGAPSESSPGKEKPMREPAT